MKVKLLKKNIKRTRRELKFLAKLYRLKMRWEESPKTPYIWVDFEKRISTDYKCVKVIELPADKIAYGKYKPSMVKYNVERQLQSWLSGLSEI